MCQSLHMYSLSNVVRRSRKMTLEMSQCHQVPWLPHKNDMLQFSIHPKNDTLSKCLRKHCLHHERGEGFNNIERTHLHRETPKTNDNSSLRKHKTAQVFHPNKFQHISMSFCKNPWIPQDSEAAGFTAKIWSRSRTKRRNLVMISDQSQDSLWFSCVQPTLTMQCTFLLAFTGY